MYTSVVQLSFTCLVSLIPSLKFCFFFSFSFSFSGAKGGAQEIKELPGGSPSIHISVGVRGKRHRRGEREKGEEDCESRLLLAADPAA